VPGKEDARVTNNYCARGDVPELTWVLLRGAGPNATCGMDRARFGSASPSAFHPTLHQTTPWLQVLTFASERLRVYIAPGIAGGFSCVPIRLLRRRSSCTLRRDGLS
jgi:hypothetical protein